MPSAAKGLPAESDRSVARVRPQWLPNAVVISGLIASIAAIIYVLAAGIPGVLVWILSTTVIVLAAAWARWRLPQHPLSDWFALGAGVSVFAQLLGEAMWNTLSTGTRVLALTYFLAQALNLLATISFTYLLGLFPDGQIHRQFERRTLGATWWLLLVPPLLLATAPVLPLPAYVVSAPIENPFHVLRVGLGVGMAGGLNDLLNLVIVVGVVLLVLRYRRFGSVQRKQIRWLLLPSLIAAFAVLTYQLFQWPDWTFAVLFIGTTLSLAVSLVLAFLNPEITDIDRVLRRSLVYGALWVAIAAVYIGVASALGLAVGQQMSIGWAITVTGVATLVLQPVRAWLEGIADRWVFGTRADPTQVIVELGATLEDTYELESLLPVMARRAPRRIGVEVGPRRSRAVPPHRSTKARVHSAHRCRRGKARRG